jgi:hypothetical protein
MSDVKPKRAREPPEPPPAHSSSLASGRIFMISCLKRSVLRTKYLVQEKQTLLGKSKLITSVFNSVREKYFCCRLSVKSNNL